MLDDNGDMNSPSVALDPIRTELRQQARYWQAMHARAVEREQYWKMQAQPWEAQVHQQEKQLEEQAGQIEALKARIIWLEQQVFGRKAEGSAGAPPEERPSPPDS